MDSFFQDPPQLGNQFLEDHLLQSSLERTLPHEIYQEIFPDLRRFGQRVVTEIEAWGNDAEKNPPRHHPFDPWGLRIDEIEVSRGWKELERISAEEGLISIGYERRYGHYSRLYQLSKLYLFNPSSAVYTCPLAMTDGACRLIEKHGDQELKDRALQKMTSRSPQEFWTSGQWMTEKTGGSDLSRSSTIARKEGDHFLLYGTKWFTSATTSQMAFTLARILNEGEPPKLSLFYLELRSGDDSGPYNGIRILRLKDKLGTRALPTAELELTGTRAKLVGRPGEGVKTMATLFNITRIYNAISAVAFSRRILALLKDYSGKRVAFGQRLIDHPLHRETLATLEVAFQGSFHLVFFLAQLLGKEDTGEASEEEKKLLRLLTPLAKLYTAKMNLSLTSEALEGFGGAGYMENTGLPKWLRDGQVLSIWEGTTNVLSLDVLRGLEKENPLPAFFREVERRIQQISQKDLLPLGRKLQEKVEFVHEHLNDFPLDRQVVEAQARSLAFTLSELMIGSLLLTHAQWSMEKGERTYFLAAKRWFELHLKDHYFPGRGGFEDNREILFPR